MKRKLTSLAVALLLCFVGTSMPRLYAQQKKDFVNLARFAEANAALPQPAKGEKRVVFMGNSITEIWPKQHPDYFKNPSYICRGISGQTSYQMVLRFREDVIKLSPSIVVIGAGTNDVAENTCPYNEEHTFGNIVTMVELARAHKIKVVLASLLPAEKFSWRKDLLDAPEKIAALNARIKAYAKANKIPYVDYHSAMLADDGRSLKAEYTYDGVHPTPEGYVVMEAILEPVLRSLK